LAAGIGIGESQLTNFNLAFQIAESRRQNAAGIVTWCWDRCALADELAGAGKQHFGPPALAPFNDRYVGTGDPAFSRTGSWTSFTEDGRTYHQTGGEASGVASWRANLVRPGYYDIYVRLSGSGGDRGAATYRLPGNEQAEVISYDQDRTGGWHRIGTRYLNIGEQLIEMENAGAARVEAGDVRFVRVNAFVATEAVTVGEGRIEIRFNREVRAASVNPASFQLSQGAIETAVPAAADARVVVLNVEGLARGERYDLTVQGLEDSEGRLGSVVTISFIYSPDGARWEVRPGSSQFSTVGSWAQVDDEAAPGGWFRKTATLGSTTRATWFTTVSEAGLYEINVWVPAAAGGEAGNAAYVIGYGLSPAEPAKYDTVYVRHDRMQAGWVSLGAYPYFAGATSLVTLRGALSDGTITAGATSWQRTLQAVGSETADRPEAPSISGPYPNPASDEVRIAINVKEPVFGELGVFDVLGRRVQQIDLNLLSPGNDEIFLDVSSLPAGAYFLRVTTRNAGSGTILHHHKRFVIIR
jgi:hypothetical protein